MAKDEEETMEPQGPIQPPLSEEQVLSEMSNSQREEEGLVVVETAIEEIPSAQSEDEVSEVPKSSAKARSSSS